MNPGKLSISQLRRAYLDRELTPVEAVESLAAAIEEKDAEIGAYLGFDLELAREEAKRADLDLPLGGIPLGIKDLINVAGQPCSCASKMLEGTYRAPYDATVIRRLREAGAIPFGRMNMDEFAMGSSNENSGIRPCRNPHDLDRIPGGSSGGSAAAVAAGTAVATLGSDTGGSIRQPASHCGVVGLKPTYGRVSRYGLVAFASSLDQIGPVTKTVADAALLLNFLAGADERDSTALREPVPDFTEAIGRDIAGMKIGLPREYFGGGIDAAVEKKVREAIAVLESLGAECVEVSLPHSEYAVATYYIIATAEASANLSRFDGVRYGHRAEAEEGDGDEGTLIRHYKKSRAEGLGPEVKRRILLGTYVLSSGYYDAHYLRAQKVRTLIRQDFTRAFEKVDLLASPVAPEPAFRIGEKCSDPLSMYLADILTISANLAGICGISVPCGRVKKGKKALPVGLQLQGKSLAEADLLRVAHAYETAVA